MMDSFSYFIAGTPHVNDKGSDQNDRNHAESSLTERFIREKVPDVAADSWAKSALQRFLLNTTVKDVSDGRAGGKASNDGGVNRRSQQFLALFAAVGQDNGNKQKRLEAFPEHDDE